MELNINNSNTSVYHLNILLYHDDIQIEVNEIVNNLGTRYINFPEFCQIILEKNSESDQETDYKVKSVLGGKESLLIRNFVGMFPSVQ